MRLTEKELEQAKRQAAKYLNPNWRHEPEPPPKRQRKPPPTEGTCTKCKKVKPRSEFYDCSPNVCKKCKKAQSRSYDRASRQKRQPSYLRK